MARPSDCIYCGANTGSREHMFPAALGGRHMNKGILCGACNEKFSPLDALLAQQLALINGIIGVRPDRDNKPRPARIQGPEGPLLLDHTGKPSFATPRVRADEMLPDGRRRLSIDFANAQQLQKWRAEQRAAGQNFQQLSRVEGQRFFTEKISVEWSFGGVNAFREIGRIALNFLAHQWPDYGRAKELRPFKDFVEGARVPADGEPSFVWYAPGDAPPLPDPRFEFGHQVLLVLEPSATYGRVRFFSTFELCVNFGQIPVATPTAVVFDIDPLAEHPPDALSSMVLTKYPAAVPPPTTDDKSFLEILHSRIGELLARVEARQWAMSTVGLLDALNAVRNLPSDKRGDEVFRLLQPHRQRVLLLVQSFAEYLKRQPQSDATQVLIKAMELMLAPDERSPDGLSLLALGCIEIGLVGLANAITRELETGPLSEEGLRLLLAGGPGAHAVISILKQPLLNALKE